MLIFTISALSLIGVPVLGGFISKAYIFLAALSAPTNYVVIMALSISVLASAHYFISIIGEAYYKKENHKDEFFQGGGYSMQAAMLITCLIATLYGFMSDWIITALDKIIYTAGG